MAEQKVMITITDSRSYRWFRQSVSVALVLIAPIGLGVYLQSTAMQWAGFLMTCVGIVAMATQGSKKFDNIADAKKYLDTLG